MMPLGCQIAMKALRSIFFLMLLLLCGAAFLTISYSLSSQHSARNVSYRCTQMDVIKNCLNGGEVGRTINSASSSIPTRPMPSAIDEKPSQKRSRSPVEQYEEDIFHRSDEKNNFTIVIQTYKRVKTLPNLLLHYCKTKNLSKIIVIWNDVGNKIPESILTVNNQCTVPIVFTEETVNKMTNRFKPRPEIETDCE